MSFKVLVCSSAAIAFAAEASAYEWLDNQHACIVETANFMAVDGSRSGIWNNAPKSFFVDITNCKSYAASLGLPFSEEANPNHPKYSDQLLIQQCVQKGEGVLEYYIVDAKGLDAAFDPQIPFLILAVPLSAMGSTLAFGKDGYIDYSEYGSLEDDGGNSWFTLRANCTVLKP